MFLMHYINALHIVSLTKVFGTSIEHPFLSRGKVQFTDPQFRRKSVRYKIPVPKFQFLKPLGFSITLPPNPLIDTFRFHAKINEQFEVNEHGIVLNAYITGLVEEPSFHGEWKYINRDYKLFDGDIIYFWTGVLTNDRIQHIKHQMCFNISAQSYGLTANYWELPNITSTQEKLA